MGGRTVKFNDIELADAVANSHNWSEVLRKVPATRYAVMTHASRLNLDTSHFMGQRMNLGRRFATWTVDEVLVLGAKHDKRVSKQLLVSSGLKELKCENCGIDEWNGQPAPLELEHTNGNKFDNRIENLKILCCNCHAQTPTWRRGWKNKRL